MERIAYAPYGRATDFMAIIERGSIKRLEHADLGYGLEIMDGGYVPKTGAFFVQKLSEYDMAGKDVIDIGTGETGILAIHAASMGARKVIGLDIDTNAVEWASRNSAVNGLSNAEFLACDIKEYVPDGRFDIIISNPPQMPSATNDSIHDDGGIDGKEYMRYIFDFALEYLKDDGKIFLSPLDFLGIERSYNSDPSLADYAGKRGFGLSVIGRQPKMIKEGSHTAKNLAWIRKQCPDYVFEKEGDGLLGYEIHIVLAQRI